MNKKPKSCDNEHEEEEKPQASDTPLLDKILPVHSAGEWPEGLSLRREDMYEDRT